MEIKFNPNLDYQNDAISAVVDIFKGQEITHSSFTVYDPKYINKERGFDGREIDRGITQKWDFDTNEYETNVGIANKLELVDEEILENLSEVQKRNHLKPASEIKSKNYNFAIEMETGTGKTYVYLKTIFELRKNYGFKKFIILVPSVAIKEGVLASIRSLAKHFKYHYPDFPFRHFQYSSKELSELLSFARNDDIEIMVMTIQSLDSDNKVLHSKSKKHLEDTGDITPIDIINRTNPIVIVDEPQTTSGSEQRKQWIKKLNPLCTLQYSATHKNEKNVHKIYRLTSVDAYIKKLVKQIEVASVIPKDDHNMAYVKLVEVKPTKTKITAKIELDVRDAKTGEITRKTVPASRNDSLYDLSGKREMYEGMIIDGIFSDSSGKSIEINGTSIPLGSAINEYDTDVIKRVQIRKTIEEHFRKERVLNPKGIKVLSLFFIDKVANYRCYDGDTVIDGKFYKWFEEEYEKVRKQYEGVAQIKAINDPVEKVHEAYFAQDKKNHFKDTKKGDSEDDIRAYNSIMKDKEYLLSFDNPIRFIFSHSALREGWDNPNVFQICTLNENAKSNDRKRQELGRGLRLCVNQDGERIYGFETNTLTVMANVNYFDYAKQLQRETEQDENFKFGSVSPLSFANIEVIGDDDNATIPEALSKEIYDFCIDKEYITDSGNITETLKNDLRENKVQLPDEAKKYEYEILDYFKRICGNLNIRDKDDKTVYNQNKRVVLDPEFVELWDRVKDKTKYFVEYEDDKLIRSCASKLKETLDIRGIEVDYIKGKIIKDTEGISVKESGGTTDNGYKYHNKFLPDIISFIQNSTYLTRATIVEILAKSETLYMFSLNPQKYMSDVVSIINSELNKIVLNGIKYTKIDGEEYFLQEVFPDEEQQVFIDELEKSSKSPYEYNRCDSNVEHEFAKSLQDDDDVKFFAKLPTKKFIVPTPLGEYTPDWVVLYNKNGVEKLYFVVETKGSVNEDDLRNKELLKIKFGKKRFKDVGGAGFVLADKIDKLRDAASKASDDGTKTKIQ